MNSPPLAFATIDELSSQGITLAGPWTARGLGQIESRLHLLHAPRSSELLIDAGRIDALDTAGALVLQKLVARLSTEGNAAQLRHLRPEFAKLLNAVDTQATDATTVALPLSHERSALQSVGRKTASGLEQTLAMTAFIGETALALARCAAHPVRLRWRPILYNIRRAGFDALPIVGVLAFLLGVVVAYQGADQLRQYGANIFVADLVGISMLREFAPLITAIIIAGRSGSAYAAQIGTMSVTEEIDAMRTLGIVPLDMLVLPKIVALVIVLPLLTVFADMLGIFGGMLMARAQLGVGFGEFLDRLVNAVTVTTYMVGIGKAPVFAAIIAVVGCFQGFRTQGGADSVGRHTTRSVVQSIFIVIVADALFSIAFSALDL